MPATARRHVRNFITSTSLPQREERTSHSCLRASTQADTRRRRTIAYESAPLKQDPYLSGVFDNIEERKSFFASTWSAVTPLTDPSVNPRPGGARVT